MKIVGGGDLVDDVNQITNISELIFYISLWFLFFKDFFLNFWTFLTPLTTREKKKKQKFHARLRISPFN